MEAKKHSNNSNDGRSDRRPLTIRPFSRECAHAHTFREYVLVRVCVCVCVSRASLHARWRDLTAERSREGFAYLPSRHLYKPDALSLLSAHRHPEHPIVGGHVGGGGGSSDPSRIVYMCIFVGNMCVFFSFRLFLSFSISEYNINIYIYIYVSVLNLSFSLQYILTSCIGLVWIEIPREFVCFPMR